MDREDSKPVTTFTPRSYRPLLCSLIVIVMGSLLHFAWEWSGQNPIVAIFAATNESTWEHLKMAFWPALLLTPIQLRLYGPLPGWLSATVIRTLLPPAIIVVLFYGYTSVLGTNHLMLDIGTYAAAVFAGEYCGHALMGKRTTPGLRRMAAVILVAATGAFSTLTFRPPSCFLFDDPKSRSHGNSNEGSQP